MNNAILFFYNINVSELKKINNNYYFNYANRSYVISLYDRDIEEAVELYYLNLELASIFPTYQIILTNQNEILFYFNDMYYVLMKFPNLKNRLITYYDVLYFNIKPTMKIKKLDKSNWGYNWSSKIDFIEYQFSQIRNKYNIIELSIDYYIGMWENAISYFNDNKVVSDKVVAHKRIDVKMDLLEFLNPLNFVIDYKERDIGEYLKSYIITNNYSENQLNQLLKRISNRNSVVLLLARILFPTYYFDLYEDIVINNTDEDRIKEIISKQKNINSFIAYVFDYYDKFNITKINWIKKDKD